jgi:eukaryotic-like serine/threonine-protein kinase
VGARGRVLESDFAGSERFRIVRKLGEGGMGAVYEVIDRDQQATVAIKTLRRTESEAMFWLKREFRGLRELVHPNLVGLYDLYVDAVPIFFSMEYVRGADLMTYVSRDDYMFDSLGHSLPKVKQPLACDEHKLRQILPQLAAGLAFLHRAGKLHRDIKPSNVQVTWDGVVKILDFGLAVDIDASESESRHGQVVGTPAYMSPEQAASQSRVGAATDWYSFGVMLYEALTGRLPHQGPSLHVLVKKTQEVPPAVRQIAPEVPEDLAELADGLLARDPQARMRGQEVLERLGVYLPAEPTPRRMTSSSGADVVAFQGRARELGALSAGFEAVCDTRCAHIVVVSGPSGIGKSSAVAEFVKRAAAAHPTTIVLRGRCYEWEAVSHKAMDAVIDDLSRYWRRLPELEATRLLPRNAQLLPVLFPVLGRVAAVARATSHGLPLEPQARRTGAYAALRETLQRLTEAAPAIVCIDDMQWADVESVTLLTDLLRPPDSPAVLLVLCIREHGLEPGTGLSALLAALGSRAWLLPMPPLTAEEGAALASAVMDCADPELAAAIASDARGNPFFITELARHHGTDGGNRAELPIHTVDHLLAARVDALEPSTRTLLEVLVVAGEPIEPMHAALAAELDRAQWAAASRALRSARLARVTGAGEHEKIAYYHDRVRETVAVRLDAARRRALHRALAVALEASGNAEPERLARHLWGGGENPKAAHYAEQAARAAESMLDFVRASELYAMALALGHHDDDARRRLLMVCGDALANAGRPAAAADALASALAIAGQAGGGQTGGKTRQDLDLLGRIAESLLWAGEYERGLQAAQAVARAAGLWYPASKLATLVALGIHALALRSGRTRLARPPGPARARRLRRRCDACQSLSSGLGLADTLRGALFGLQWQRLARALGEPDQYARALALVSISEATVGTAERASRYVSCAARHAEDSGSDTARAFVAAARQAIAFFVSNDWPAALAHGEQCHQLWRSAGRGDSVEIEFIEQLGFGAMRLQGAYRRLAEEIPKVIGAATRAGRGYRAVAMRVSYVEQYVAADEPERAERELAEALAAWKGASDELLAIQFAAVLRAAEASLYRHDLNQARTQLASKDRAIRRSLLLRVNMYAIDYVYLRARLALASAAQPKNGASARPHLKTALRCARRLGRRPQPLAQAYALMTRAAAARIQGRDEQAVALLRVAGERLEQRGTMAYASVVKRQLGVSLGGDEGEALVTEADLWLTRQGIRRPDRFAAMMLPGWRHPDA